MADAEADEVAALLRAGIWALFAAASMAREWHGPTPPGTADIRSRAATEADELLEAFGARFPLEALLAE